MREERFSLQLTVEKKETRRYRVDSLREQDCLPLHQKGQARLSLAY